MFLSNNKKDSLYKDYPLLIRREDDEIWRIWVNIASPNTSDLHSLLTSDEITDRFKARALVIFLKYFPEIYWREDGKEVRQENKKVPYCRISLNNISTPLLQFAWKIISSEWERIWKSKDCTDTQIRILYTYLHYMRELLVLLPDEQAKQVYALYPINNPDTHWGKSYEIWYHPFLLLMLDEKIPLEYRKKADAEMRQIIWHDLKRSNQEIFTDALFCYMNVLLTHIAIKKQYEVDFFVDQIQFLIKCLRINTNPKVKLQLFQVSHILKKLPEEERTLRLELAHFMIEHPNEIVVYEQTYDAALQLKAALDLNREDSSLFQKGITKTQHDRILREEALKNKEEAFNRMKQ